MKAKVLAVGILWLILCAIGVTIYKFFIVPANQKKAEIAAKNEKTNILINTSADSHYKSVINFGIDSFSGYSLFRNKDFIQLCSDKSIKINLIDDNANYENRLNSLQSGELQMAVFTIGALIESSNKLNDLPATIVAIIDETQGADAIVGYKTIFPNIDSLNSKDLSIICTSNSPSETLARVLMANFKLSQLNNDNFKFTKDASEVYQIYRQSNPKDKKIFILWEPYVSKILENPNTATIADSSKFKGYIVDVIVASRDFLIKNENVVKDVIESYYTTVYSNKDNMLNIITIDSVNTGQPINSEQAKKLVNGIKWKNTLENYSHFGLGDKKLQHIEDIVSNITNVLIKTGAIDKDPVQGKYNYWYTDTIMKMIFNESFHPGQEIVSEDKVLEKLTDNQWDGLVSVGTLSVKDIVFARGTSLLTQQSKDNIDELVKTLKSFPQYYLIVEGNASNKGNLEANKKLAQERSEIVVKYLIDHGIESERVKATSANPKNIPSVSFLLKQLAY